MGTVNTIKIYGAANILGVVKRDPTAALFVVKDIYIMDGATKVDSLDYPSTDATVPGVTSYTKFTLVPAPSDALSIQLSDVSAPTTKLSFGKFISNKKSITQLNIHFTIADSLLNSFTVAKSLTVFVVMVRPEHVADPSTKYTKSASGILSLDGFGDWSFTLSEVI